MTTATVRTVLTGHTSFETAYEVGDYPYGFRLRCKIRYWIETTKHGSRVVSCTTNPKRPGEVWNKPKASTYSPIRVLFIDDTTGYVENTGLGIYSREAEIAAFEAAFGSALTSERDRKTLALLNVLAAREARMAAERAEALAS